MRRLLVLPALLLLLAGIARAADAPDLTLGQPDNGNTVASDIPDASTIPYLRIAAWNIGSLAATAGGSDKDLYSMAEIIARFDVVALQRNAPQDQLAQMLGILQTLTGSPWSQATAPAEQPGSATDRLAIIWRADRVTGVNVGPVGRLLGGAVPISMSLKFKGHAFVVADIAIPSEAHDASAYDQLTQYAATLVRSFPSAPVFLGCTCGVTPADKMLAPLKEFMAPAATSQGTLISIGGGRTPGAYDNIWTNIGSPFQSGVLPTSQVLSFNGFRLVSSVSDHEPPFILVTLN